MSGALAPIKRQDGRLYRPRKVVACAIVEGGDELTGVVVFGTHDAERAQPLADEYVTWLLDRNYRARSPVAGWWRDGYDDGQRVWRVDEVRGRAGVMFERIEYAPDVTP